MHSQFLQLVEGLRTALIRARVPVDRALPHPLLVLLVHLHMPVQLVARVEAGTAAFDRTLELLGAGVRKHVALQVRVAEELLAAARLIADVSLLARVHVPVSVELADLLEALATALVVAVEHTRVDVASGGRRGSVRGKHDR